MSALPPHFTVLQIVPRLDTGGAEQTTVDIAAAVQAEGGRALVASMGGRMTKTLEASGAELIKMSVHSKNPLVMLANGFRLAGVVRRRKVSLIHVRSRAPAFSALLAARLTGVPLVATYHGIYNARSALKRRYNGVMTRGDAIIANSEFTRARVIAEHEVPASKVIAIPRGVDLRRFSPAAVTPGRLETLARAWALDPADRRVKVLLAGRLTRWKGQTLAIQAAARLKAQDRAFVMLLAGDAQGRSAYLTEIETLIRAAGLQQHVHVVGHCADMPAAYLLCDIAIAPSLDPEAFGRTGVEPQLMGRPVVAADHGATRETVVPGQTGWLAKPGDVDDWTRVLGEAIGAGADKRAVMGKAAMTRARALYSVDAMCDATLKVYADVMARRR